MKCFAGCSTPRQSRTRSRKSQASLGGGEGQSGRQRALVSRWDRGSYRGCVARLMTHANRLSAPMVAAPVGMDMDVSLYVLYIADNV